MNNNNRHAAMMERKQELMQQKSDAGFISTHFPDVARIEMHMTYNQKGARSILRTIHFTPDSYAFFVVNCLRKDCVDGGFDLTGIVTTMIKGHRAETKGTLCCKGTEPSASHSDISYQVAIQYS